MRISEKYDKFFMNQLVRIKMKIQRRKKKFENAIFLSNENEDYIFCDTSSSPTTIKRNKKRVI